MYQYKAKLIRVVDGDTVDAMIDCGFSTFKKERIRLYGIDTPECRTRDKEEKARGLAAKARLEELIAEGNNEFIIETSIDKKGKLSLDFGEHGVAKGKISKKHKDFYSVAEADPYGIDASSSWDDSFGLPSTGTRITRLFITTTLKKTMTH